MNNVLKGWFVSLILGWLNIYTFLRQTWTAIHYYKMKDRE